MRFPCMHRVDFELLPQSFLGELRHQQRPDRLAKKRNEKIEMCYLFLRKFKLRAYILLQSQITFIDYEKLWY